MMAISPHKAYHASDEFYIHPDMIHPQLMNGFMSFLNDYVDGITQDIAFKLLFYFKRALRESETDTHGLFELASKIRDWSQLSR
jgi:hypothetical protein